MATTFIEINPVATAEASAEERLQDRSPKVPRPLAPDRDGSATPDWPSRGISPTKQATAGPQLFAALGVLAGLLCCLLFTLLLCIAVAVDVLLVIPVLRVGLAGCGVGVLGTHLRLLTAFWRGLWLLKSESFEFPLKREDAPELFILIERLCHQAGVQPPVSVCLIPGANAWVSAKGLLPKSRSIRIGLGLDLLAGLSRPEVTAVLAHEVAHAKQVPWNWQGFSAWGRSRIVVLALHLDEINGELKRVENGSVLASLARRLADFFAGLTSRACARASRQHEFDADRDSAALAGLAAVRSALSKLSPLAFNCARLPWSERLAHLDVPGSYTTWLSRELRIPAPASVVAARQRPLDPYATHPTDEDRLAALPPSSECPQAKPGEGLELLKDPDGLAKRFLSELRQFGLEQELRDTKDLTRIITDLRRAGPARKQRLAGWFLLTLAALWAGGVVCTNTEYSFVLVLPAIMVFVGILLQFSTSTPEAIQLRVPTGEVMRRAKPLEGEALREQLAKLEAELLNDMGIQPQTEGGAEDLLRIARSSLGECDYAKAWVASLMVSEEFPYCWEAQVYLAVSSAGIGFFEQSGRLLGQLKQEVEIPQEPGTCRGVAWALSLLGDWRATEALLNHLHESGHSDPGLLMALATAQIRRGKNALALKHARAALALLPDEVEILKEVTLLLLMNGNVEEATKVLEDLLHRAPSDAEVSLLVLHKDLVGGDHARLPEDERDCRRLDPSPRRLFQMAELFESVRHSTRAEELLLEATRLGHYPEALIGLAGYCQRRNDNESARRLLLEALNLITPVVEGARPALGLVAGILRQLLSLQTPCPDCRVWRAILKPDASPDCLQGGEFVVYATDAVSASEQLKIILQALRAGLPPLADDMLQIDKLPDNLQPQHGLPIGVELAC